MSDKFLLNDYICNQGTRRRVNNSLSVCEGNWSDFDSVCQMIQDQLDKEFQVDDQQTQERNLEIQRKAIMGYSSESNYYLEKISQILLRKNLKGHEYPPWYRSLEEGIFAELYGFAGLTPWIYDHNDCYKGSSSAKLIGGRLFCLIDGKSQLQPQRLSPKRFEQLKRALLMASPRERLEKGFHEVYLKNGIRITIFSGEKTKEGQEIIVFRKYVLKEMSFESLARLNTIPYEAIDLFRVMIKLGFNVIFAGQVRSGKTTFLQIWQSYEDPSLEGLTIATDPETPWHRIMGDAPIMQLVVDGEELESITKSLLRGDNDYVLLEEMRDARAFNLALDITSTGTQRSKATIHDNDSLNIPYKMASKIKAHYGGDYNGIIAQIFRNFNYVFEFYQLPEDKSQKRLKGIFEYSYDGVRDNVIVNQICKFNSEEEKWLWKFHLGEDKRKVTENYPLEEEEFINILKKLEKESPNNGHCQFKPSYYQGNIRSGE